MVTVYYNFMSYLRRDFAYLITVVLHANLATDDEWFLQTQSIKFRIKLQNEEKESVSNLLINEIFSDLQSMEYVSIGNANANKIKQINRRNEFALGTNALYFTVKIDDIQSETAFPMSIAFKESINNMFNCFYTRSLMNK